MDLLTSNHEPALSVVIPVYNAARWLRECMESILSQDFTDVATMGVGLFAENVGNCNEDCKVGCVETCVDSCNPPCKIQCNAGCFICCTPTDPDCTDPSDSTEPDCSDPTFPGKVMRGFSLVF